jgi:hypothetical protein
VTIHHDQVQAGQLPTGMRHGGWSAVQNGAHNLHADKLTRYTFVACMCTQIPTQGIALRFVLDQLDQCRRIEMEPHRSRSRIARRTLLALKP